MKVVVENVVFKPITITLESEVELDILMSLLCNNYFEDGDVEDVSSDMVESLRFTDYTPTLKFINRR